MIRSKGTFLLCTAAALAALQVGCRHKQQCNGAAAPAPSAAPAPVAAAPVAPAAPAPVPLTSEQLAARYAECWTFFNDKKWDNFGNCYTEDGTSSHGSMPADMFKGRSQIIDHDAKVFAAAFPDVKGERLLTLINGNHVASIALLTGTQTGALDMGMGPAIPATGKKTGHMMLHWGEFTPAGQLAKQWIEADTPTMLAHLGVSKAPARPVISKLPAEPQVVIAKSDEKEAKNVEAHKKGYELFNAKNPAFSDLLGEGLMEHDYSMPADAIGKKTLTSKLQGIWKGFSDIHMNMDEVWGAGDYTFVRGHMTGTNDGDMPMMKLKKTGKKIDVAFGEVAQWDNGKLKTIYFFMDGMDMAGQLGLLAPPPAAAPAAQPAAAQPAAKPAAQPAPAPAAAPAAQPAAKPAPAMAPAPAPAKK